MEGGIKGSGHQGKGVSIERGIKGRGVSIERGIKGRGVSIEMGINGRGNQAKGHKEMGLWHKTNHFKLAKIIFKVIYMIGKYIYGATKIF